MTDNILVFVLVMWLSVVGITWGIDNLVDVLVRLHAHRKERKQSLRTLRKSAATTTALWQARLAAVRAQESPREVEVMR